MYVYIIQFIYNKYIYNVNKTKNSRVAALQMKGLCKF